MEKMLNLPISSVSMHRPSKQTLEANYRIPGIINSYSKMFLKSLNMCQIRGETGGKI